MIKHSKIKLRNLKVDRETVRTLSTQDLARAVGATKGACESAIDFTWCILCSPF